VSDCEAMEALYGESYDELLLSEICTWYQSLLKTISKVLEHYKTHNIETKSLFFPMNVNESYWALLIADIKNRKITSMDSMQGICKEFYYAHMMLSLYLNIYFSNQDINSIQIKSSSVQSSLPVPDSKRVPHFFPFFHDGLKDYRGIPTHDNLYDCGVYVLAYLSYKMLNKNTLHLNATLFRL